MNAIHDDGARRRLVSLWSWSFSCTSDRSGFEALVRRFDRAPFARESVRLPISLLSGERSKAAYRGPLVPLARTADDGESRANAPTEGEDISQDAAMELGRLLALEDKSISVGLLRLKRCLSHKARLATQIEASQHVYPHAMPPLESVRPPALSLLPIALRRLLTPELAGWAEGLLKLEGVPFRYLLPDEKLLPKESLRSFQVDEQWITNLLVGALGVGGAWRLDADAKADLPDFEAALRAGQGPIAKEARPFGPLPKLTGVVLRSEVVSGWPMASLHAQAHGGRGILQPCRLTRLSKNILLALFEGTIEKIVFRLPRETLHLEPMTGTTLPEKWLADAKNSVELGRWVKLATQVEVACDV